MLDLRGHNRSLITPTEFGLCPMETIECTADKVCCCQGWLLCLWNNSSQSVMSVTDSFIIDISVVSQQNCVSSWVRGLLWDAPDPLTWWRCSRNGADGCHFFYDRIWREGAFKANCWGLQQYPGVILLLTIHDFWSTQSCKTYIGLFFSVCLWTRSEVNSWSSSLRHRWVPPRHADLIDQSSTYSGKDPEQNHRSLWGDASDKTGQEQCDHKFEGPKPQSSQSEGACGSLVQLDHSDFFLSACDTVDH